MSETRKNSKEIRKIQQKYFFSSCVWENKEEKADKNWARLVQA